MKEKIDKALNKLNNVTQWISNCDAKSSFALALLGVMITIIFTSNIGIEMFEVFDCKKIESIDWISIKYFIRIISVLIFFVGIIVTVYFIFMTLKGRINPKVYREGGLNVNSNIFFGSISNKTFATFESESNQENDATYLNDINSQVFINSKIANEKFKNYNRSLISILITIGAFLLFVILK